MWVYKYLLYTTTIYVNPSTLISTHISTQNKYKSTQLKCIVLWKFILLGIITYTVPNGKTIILSMVHFPMFQYL